MGSVSREILHDVPPYIRVYKDGTIERLVGTETTPPGHDPVNGVTSKDITITTPKTNISARIYRPTSTMVNEKLPLVIYFHGGAFVIASPAEPKYHASVSKLVAESHVIAVSVDYRLAPENPLPAAFEDACEALRWVSDHAPQGPGSEEWIRDHVDFDKVFIGGDSAGATIAHQMALRVGSNPSQSQSQSQTEVQHGSELKFKISGIILINPYFWGKDPIGSEKTNSFLKSMVDKWWEFVCPSDSDHPLINPFVDGAPDLSGLGCGRVLVTVSEMDILKDRGWAYYEKLVKSKYEGKVEMYEVESEDHVFHIFDANAEKAVNLMKRIGTFINEK